MIFKHDTAKKFSFIEKHKNLLVFNLIIFFTIMWSVFILVQADSFMYVLNRTGVFLVFLFCLYKGFKESELFNPYFLFLPTPISLMLYFESLSPFYLVELTQLTWNIAIINMIMFVIGLSIVKSNRKTDSMMIHGDVKKHYYIKNLKIHAYSLLFLGLLPTFFSVFAGFPSLIKGDFQTLKTFANIMPLSSIFTLFKFPAIVSAIKTKNKNTISITLILCLFAIIVNFSKFEIGILMFTVFISVYRYSGSSKLKIAQLMFYVFVGSLIMLWAFDFYDTFRGFDTANYLLQTGRISSSVKKDLVLPYLYLTTPWTNLQFVIENNTSYTFGLWMFKPFINYLSLDTLFYDQYILVSRTTFNTFTYITVLFRDFGSIGSAIISFVMGLFIKKIYKLYKQVNSPFITAVYALNAYAIFMMFFSNHWFGLSYPITIIIIMFFYNVFFVRYCSKNVELGLK
jgi:oligosaccharide repeat unit polymerase